MMAAAAIATENWLGVGNVESSLFVAELENVSTHYIHTLYKCVCVCVRACVRAYMNAY